MLSVCNADSTCGHMESGNDRRRHSRTRKTFPQTLRLTVEDYPGGPKAEVISKLADTSDGGCCVDLGSPLNVGSVVLLDGQVARAPKPGLWSARVTWCRLNAPGAYSAGLRLEAPAERDPRSTQNNLPGIDDNGKPFFDYYDALQLSNKADPDTIHRVYRLLAQRHHPDNPDTGSEEIFKRILEAYEVLRDPQQRAAYDVRHGSEQRLRWKIFNQPKAAQGKDAERRKRLGVLAVLYTRRVNEPGQPSMGLAELEDLLAIPREHLEFSLWYLKERGWVTKSDNGRNSITAAGVEQAEATEIPWAREDRLLPAAS